VSTTRTQFAVDLLGANQSTHDRKLQPGEHTELINFRRSKAGKLEKRNGLVTETINTFVNAPYTGPATAFECSNTRMVRDSADRIWALNGSSGYYRGQHQRAWPSTLNLPTKLPTEGARKTVGVYHNNQWWQFSVGRTAPGAATSYQLTVIDPATGVTIFDSGTEAPATIAAANLGGCVAISHATGVRFLYFQDDTGANRDTIFCHTFTGPTVTPVITTYATIAGTQLTSIDAHLMTSDGRVLVTATSFTLPGGAPFGIATLYWSTLNTTTNVATGSNTIVTNTSSVSDHRTCNGVGIMNYSGANGFAYISYWRPQDSPRATQLVRVKITLATMASAGELLLGEFTGAIDGFVGYGLSGGWLDGTDENYVGTLVGSQEDYYVAAADEVPHGPQFTSAVTTRYLYNGSLVIPIRVAPSATLASKPFQVGEELFFLTHFNDPRGVQRGYWLRDENGIPLVCLLDGSAASPMFGGGLLQGGTNGYEYKSHSGHVVTPAVNGTTVYFPLLTEFLTSRSFQPVFASVDFAAEYYSTANDILPGGIPAYVSASDEAFELSPLHFPYEPIRNTELAAPTTALATCRMTYRYALIDSQGRQYLSAPYPTTVFNFFNIAGGNASIPLALPTLRHSLGGAWEQGKISILLYSSVNGGTDPYLQHVVANDPQQDFISLTVFPLQFSATGELLDTIGVSQGVLDQSALPAFRLVTQGKDRVWGVDPDDSIWFSQRSKAGRGPEFNEALSTSWPDGTGPITAIAPLPGQDALVVFRKDAIGIISGDGPDGLAINGSFKVATLPTKAGCTNPFGVVSGPLGVYYPRDADGRMALVAGLSPPVEIHQGMESYRSYVPVASLHVESERLVKWYCDIGGQDGEILNLDDNWKGDVSPAGKWILDRRSSAPFEEFVGARVIDGVPTVLLPGGASLIQLQAPDGNYSDGGAAVLTKQTTGRMSPTGFQNEFDVLEVQISSTRLDGDSTYTYTLTRDTGGTEVHTDITDTTADVKFWSAIDRTRDVRLTIEETSSTGAGREFDGVLFEIGAYGRPQNPRRRIQ
jgi:hypothetical protein